MIPGRREWDREVLQTCMYIKEVCRIRLSNTMEDTIVWHHEKSGIFSVKSAYRLAPQIDQAEKMQVGSNTVPNGRS
jgi:hypothetical protein